MPQTIGFLGLGAMGGAMARNLLAAGYPLVAFDPVSERLAAVVAAGAAAGDGAADVARRAEIVCASLTDSDCQVAVAEADLLPVARAGQVVVVLGTVVPAEQRRLSAAFAGKGAAMLDVPVSGGPGGAERGTLRMFAGGERAVFDACRPMLDVLGEPEHVVYCGPAGCGQVVKGVNQLAMGLTNAALLEALAFGVLAGVDVDVLGRAVGSRQGHDWRGQLAALAGRVAAGSATDVDVKYGQLDYFLDEADRKGFELPIARALRAFCRDGEPIYREGNRLVPSLWRELERKKR